MGKKSKQNSNSNSQSESTTASIITVTQFKRSETIKILVELIQNQTYKNIIEWVIVEGSPNESDRNKNKQFIDEIITNKPFLFPINYIIPPLNTKLGELRNIGNRACMGDITVCMDDDDYYPPTRVEHAVHKLLKSTSKIAGCTRTILFDYDLNKLYQFKGFGPFHSINTCMAWKKEYILTHSHDSSKEMAEESSFTNEFKEPMVQLDAEHSVVLSSHSINTFNKKRLILQNQLVDESKSSTNELSVKITKMIPTNIFEKYQNIFCKNFPDYDIIYFCGAFSIQWDPVDQKLGGSEQAVVHLSENFAKNGKTVAVFGEVPDKRVNNVDYYSWTKFPYYKKHNIVILWRTYGIQSSMHFDLMANNIYIDVHDNTGGYREPKVIAYLKDYTKYTKILVKSQYHKNCFLQHLNTTEKNGVISTAKVCIPDDKFVIMLNGLRLESFKNMTNVYERNPYRFCYCSCYRRGLDNILENIWPTIYKYEPRAELHVYYGMDGIQDEEVKKKFKMLLSTPGVMDHGRQPMDMIIREKRMSTYQLYITHTVVEIDCISIRESLVTGCIPLLSNFGVFGERDGIHIDTKDAKMIPIKIIQMLKANTPESLNKLREEFLKSPTIVDWETISGKWLQLFSDNGSNTNSNSDNLTVV